jgi:hypothetical protein
MMEKKRTSSQFEKKCSSSLQFHFQLGKSNLQLFRNYYSLLIGKTTYRWRSVTTFVISTTVVIRVCINFVYMMFIMRIDPIAIAMLTDTTMSSLVAVAELTTLPVEPISEYLLFVDLVVFGLLLDFGLLDDFGALVEPGAFEDGDLVE